MPDTPADQSSPRPEGQAPAKGAAGKPRESRGYGRVIVVLLLIAGLAAAYRFGYVSVTMRPTADHNSDRKLGTLFTRVPADQLLAPDDLLKAVGRSPVDPSKVLFPAFEKVVDHDADKRRPPDAPPTEQPAVTADKPVRVAESGDDDKPSPMVETPARTPDGPDAPAVAPRGPAPAAKGSPPDTKAVVERKDREPSKPEEKAKAVDDSERPTAPARRYEEKDRHRKTIEKPAPPGSTEPESPQAKAAVEERRLDQFQLPGSMSVKIHNYNGQTPKWRLLVILDDSGSMGKKVKSWNVNRMEVALNVLKKVQEAMPPGSQIAIRDFLCPKDGGKAKGAGHCLSHMLYDWNAAPFKELQEKLGQVNPGGVTNPCAAAAFALKKDLGSSEGGKPRLLILTDGSTRCAFKETLGVLEGWTGKEKPAVDVVALGIHRKRQAGYSKVAERSHGLFLKVERPTEVDGLMAKYAKLLKTPVMEKIEVRGEKAVLQVNPEEEIALAPGTYTVVLPAVAGISPAKRAIESVQIRSGETTLIQVKVKKGKPVAKIGKK